MESKESHIVWHSYDNQVSRTVTILIYSASTLNVPEEITSILKTKLFRYLWSDKKDKIKREGLYQDIHKCGLCMVDTEVMFTTLKLAWIPSLFSSL